MALIDTLEYLNALKLVDVPSVYKRSLQGFQPLDLFFIPYIVVRLSQIIVFELEKNRHTWVIPHFRASESKILVLEKINLK